jgi:RecJ-like exonuclease
LGDLEGLTDRAREIGGELIQKVSEGRNPIILGRLGTDGICAASLLAKAVQRKKGKPIVRIVPSVDSKAIDDLRKSGHDWILFCELGAGLVSKLKETLNEDWLLIDHNQYSGAELGEENVFNPVQFGYEGGSEVCATTMAYLLSLAIDRSNIDLAWLSVLASLAERHDLGERRSLLGLNKIALDDAISTKTIVPSNDLLLFGRETRPLHQAISSTINPYIPNLSGNEDASLATLVSSGIKVKVEDRWRTLVDLDEDDKKKLVQVIVPFLTPSESADEALDEILGNVYTLVQEDEHSSLRDGREFSALLDACVGMGSASVGVSICLGDRDQALLEGERLLVSYRQKINRYVRTLLNDDMRIVESSKSFLVSGDGLVDENMLGHIASILSSLARLRGKVLLIRSITQSGEARYSARKTPHYSGSVNLGEIMSEASRELKGRGGGNDSSAGARVSMPKSESFLRLVNSKL